MHQAQPQHDTPQPAPHEISSPASPSPARPLARIINSVIVILMLFSLLEAVLLSKGGLHGNDFKHLWAGAFLLAHGRSPYNPEELFHLARLSNLGGINPYVYLPTTGLLLRPMAALTFPEARLAWFWLNWALAWLIVLAGPRLLRVARPGLAQLAGAVFLAGAFTFFRQQTAGQMNVATAALILAAAAALRRRRPLPAGLALALGFAWKIAPAFLILTLAAQWRWRGARRAALWGALASLLLLLTSIAVLGWPVHRESLPVLRQMGYGQSTWSEHGMDFYRSPFNQSPNALMHHLFTVNPYTQPWHAASPALANGLTWLISLALFGAWLWRANKVQQLMNRTTDYVNDYDNDNDREGKLDHIRSSDAQLSLFFAASLLMLLLPSLMWDHYVVQALPALLWVFGAERTARRPARSLLLLLILFFLSVLWIHESPRWQHGLGVLLMSIRFWPLLALFFLLLQDARSRPSSESGMGILAHDPAAQSSQ